MLNTWSLQKKWTAYRADCVSKTVGEICTMMRTKHTGKYLSTAVFPDADSTYETKKQDFNKWISYGYLDIVTPMAYYDNTDTLTSALNTMLKSAKNCICYAGLSATYHNLSVEKVFEQTEACKSSGAQGFIFFGSQSILGNQTYLSAFATKFKN
jgi:uncharacterized lipoprotein YddW (UPF0748 family)